MANNIYSGGTATVNSGDRLELLSGGTANGTIVFSSPAAANQIYPGGTVQIDGTTMPATTISGFIQGDIVDLRNVSATAPLSVTYNNVTRTLTLGSTGSLAISGKDPVPTFALLPDGNGGTKIESTSLQSLLALSFDTYNSLPVGADGYAVFDGDIMTDAGFRAVAYIDQSAGGADPNIVIAFRGTNNTDWLTFIKNWITNLSFPSGLIDATLVRYVYDAISFVQKVYNQAKSQDPGAVITLTGHSLGGALAQIVGAGANLAAAAFDAPGSGTLFGQLQLLSPFSPVAGIGSGGTNINYRLNGDQVSEAGTTLGQAFTIASSFASSTVSETVANVLNNHAVNPIPDPTRIFGFTGFQYAYQFLDGVGDYTPGVTGINITGPLAAAASAVGGNLLQITIQVIAGIASIIDPPGGTLFTVTGNAGSPNIASITLPFLTGVGSYDVAYEIGSSYSAFQQIAPGVADTFPAGVHGIEILPLDNLGNSTTTEPSFLFTLTFGSSGTFSGTLDVSGAGHPEGQPVTSPITLDVLLGTGPTALGIAAPADVAFPDPTTLSVRVNALPTNGVVTLSDGVTAVTVGEVLTVAQLTNLDFTPYAAASTSSVFSYDVSDEAFASAVGTATVNVRAVPPTIAGLTPNQVEKGQTTVIGTVRPGAAGDELTLNETAGSGTLSFGAVLTDGTQQVIYTAPAIIPLSTTDAVSFSVIENGTSASGTASVQLDAGPSVSLLSFPPPLADAHETVTIATATPGIVSDTLSLVITQAPQSGSVSLQGTSVQFMPSVSSELDDSVDLGDDKTKLNSFSFYLKDQLGGATPSVTVIIGGNRNHRVVGNASGYTDVSLGNVDTSITLSGSYNVVEAGNGSNAVTGGVSNNTIVLGNGSDTVKLSGGGNTVTLGRGRDTVSVGGSANQIKLGNGNDVVHGGSGDTITLTGNDGRLALYGSKEMLFISGSGARIDDLSQGLELVLSGKVDDMTLTDFAKDPTGVIDLRSGLGGFTTAQAVIAALQSDHHGGTLLSFGHGNSLDFVGVTVSQLHSSSFQIG